MLPTGIVEQSAGNVLDSNWLQVYSLLGLPLASPISTEHWYMDAPTK